MEAPHHIVHDGEGALYPQNTTSSDANLPDVKQLWEGVPCQRRGKVEVSISILTVWLVAASTKCQALTHRTLDQKINESS
jgi:hypothetical protein